LDVQVSGAKTKVAACGKSRYVYVLVSRENDKDAWFGSDPAHGVQGMTVQPCCDETGTGNAKRRWALAAWDAAGAMTIHFETFTKPPKTGAWAGWQEARSKCLCRTATVKVSVRDLPGK